MDGTPEVPVPSCRAPDGSIVDKGDVSDLETGKVKDGLPDTITERRTVAVEKDGATEVALLLAGATEAGRLRASWQASYGVSGFA